MGPDTGYQCDLQRFRGARKCTRPLCVFLTKPVENEFSMRWPPVKITGTVWLPYFGDDIKPITLPNLLHYQLQHHIKRIPYFAILCLRRTSISTLPIVPFSTISSPQSANYDGFLVSTLSVPQRNPLTASTPNKQYHHVGSIMPIAPPSL